MQWLPTGIFSMTQLRQRRQAPNMSSSRFQRSAAALRALQGEQSRECFWPSGWGWKGPPARMWFCCHATFKKLEMGSKRGTVQKLVSLRPLDADAVPWLGWPMWRVSRRRDPRNRGMEVNLRSRCSDRLAVWVGRWQADRTGRCSRRMHSYSPGGWRRVP